MRTKLKIVHAHSMDNGIRFYSKCHKGYVAISTIDDLGNIITEWTTMKTYKKERNKHDKIAENKKTFIFILGILPFVTVFSILFSWINSKNPMFGMRFYLLSYALMILSTFIITTCIKRKKEKNLYKFHSAEHMVLNAYRELKRVPSLEEIHKYSPFSNSCGTNGTTQIIMTFTLMFFCTFIHNSLYMVIGMLSVNIIVLVLLQCGLLNFLQKLTTITPTDRELEVAILGMNIWLENEKKEKEKSKFVKLLHQLLPIVFN